MQHKNYMPSKTYWYNKKIYSNNQIIYFQRILTNIVTVACLLIEVSLISRYSEGKYQTFEMISLILFFMRVL